MLILSILLVRIFENLPNLTYFNLTNPNLTQSNLIFQFQTLFGRTFWAVTVLLMLTLGIYWCVQAYDGWAANPVLTTITSTGLPVEQVISNTLNVLNVFNFLAAFAILNATFK
jgi:hypothetical protein